MWHVVLHSSNMTQFRSSYKFLCQQFIDENTLGE